MVLLDLAGELEEGRVEFEETRERFDVSDGAYKVRVYLDGELWDGLDHPVTFPYDAVLVRGPQEVISHAVSGGQDPEALGRTSNVKSQRGRSLEMSGHGETVTAPQPMPTLHKPVPMGVRVKIPGHYHGKDREVWGEVQGVASAHVVWTYIVILEKELETPFGTVRAVTVPGPELEGEGGIDWRYE